MTLDDHGPPCVDADVHRRGRWRSGSSRRSPWSAAVMILFSRKAVHSALWMAMTMIILAVMFIMQGGVFLGVVQVVVYTGAVMMLFLFVLMLVGVDASDSFVETLRGQRVVGVLLGAGLRLAAWVGHQPGGIRRCRQESVRPTMKQAVTSRPSPRRSSLATCSPSRSSASC